MEPDDSGDAVSKLCDIRISLRPGVEIKPVKRKRCGGRKGTQRKIPRLKRRSRSAVMAIIIRRKGRVPGGF